LGRPCVPVPGPCSARRGVECTRTSLRTYVPEALSGVRVRPTSG
jgi:hypothetical protein